MDRSRAIDPQHFFDRLEAARDLQKIVRLVLSFSCFLDGFVEQDATQKFLVQPAKTALGQNRPKTGWTQISGLERARIRRLTRCGVPKQHGSQELTDNRKLIQQSLE